MHKIALIYGLIGGAIVAALMWLTLGTGMVNFDNGEAIGYTTMIIALSVIFFGIKSYRDQHGLGHITFGKAFLIGLYIALIASTIYVLSWLILSSTMEVDFIDQYTQHLIEQMNVQQLPQSEIDAKLKELESFKEMYKNPMIKIGFTYLEILPVGLIVSLISAFILKRK